MIYVISAFLERKAREEREAREAAEAAARAAKKEREEREAAALAQIKEKEAREAAQAAAALARAEEEAREREAALAAQKEKEAQEEAAKAAAAYRQSNVSSLDQFDLGAASGEYNGQDRASEISDFGSEFGSEFNGGRDSWRLSQVLDLGVLDGVDMSGTRNYRDRSSTLSELQNISEEGAEVVEPRNRRHSHQPVDEGEECLSEDENAEEEGELCGGCGLVLEGEAVEALNQYFHYEVRFSTFAFA